MAGEKRESSTNCKNCFWHNNYEYMVTSLEGVYAIVTQTDFKIIISNSNFIGLLNMEFLEGKSFKELLPELLFED